MLAYFLKVKVSCLRFQRRKSWRRRRREKRNEISSPLMGLLFFVSKSFVWQKSIGKMFWFFSSTRKATHASYPTGICNSSDFIKDFALDFFICKHYSVFNYWLEAICVTRNLFDKIEQITNCISCISFKLKFDMCCAVVMMIQGIIGTCYFFHHRRSLRTINQEPDNRIKKKTQWSTLRFTIAKK